MIESTVFKYDGERQWIKKVNAVCLCELEKLAKKFLQQALKEKELEAKKKLKTKRTKTNGTG